MSALDSQILTVLMGSDEPLTAYRLSRKTGISDNQMRFRLDKLRTARVVETRVNGGVTTYSIHPALRKMECMNRIVARINDIVAIIDREMETEVEGMGTIIGFLMARVEVSQKRKDTP